MADTVKKLQQLRAQTEEELRRQKEEKMQQEEAAKIADEKRREAEERQIATILDQFCVVKELEAVSASLAGGYVEEKVWRPNWPFFWEEVSTTVKHYEKQGKMVTHSPTRFSLQFNFKPGNYPYDYVDVDVFPDHVRVLGGNGNSDCKTKDEFTSALAKAILHPRVLDLTPDDDDWHDQSDWSTSFGR